MDYLTAAAIFWTAILLPFVGVGLYAVYCEERDNRRSKAAHAAWLAARKAKQARKAAAIGII